MGSTRTGGRSASLIVVLALAVSLGACSKPRTAGKPAASGPVAGEPASGKPASGELTAGEPAVSDGHVTYCRAYADRMAGRELQRDYDSMEGRFRGGESRVFRDFAKMGAQKNYRRIYENCVRNRTAHQRKPEDGAKSN